MVSNGKNHHLLKFDTPSLLCSNVLRENTEIQSVGLLRVCVSPTRTHEKNQSINEKFEH